MQRSLRFHLLAVFTLTFLAGCVHLEPYAEVTERLPAEKLVTVEPAAASATAVAISVEPVSRHAQQVYVEQAGEGRPVILLHGFGGSSYSFRHLIPALAEEYRVLAPDLSGFGFTERPQQLEAYTVEGQLALVIALMDRFGIQQADFIGHSYGGSLSIALADAYPERVRSLVLLDSAAPDYPWKRRRKVVAWHWTASLFVRGLGLRRPLVRRALERSYYDDSLVTDGLLAAYHERLAIQGAVRAYQGLTAPLEEAPAPPELRRIEQPALALWGANDTLIPVAEARRAIAMMPNARFEVISDAGHSPMEERPVEVARRVLEFLDGLERSLLPVGSADAPY